MKVGRQTKIIELITKHDIETQEELAERLLEAGFNVTQATISRDIRDLKLTKIATDDNKQKYIILQAQDAGLYEKYLRLLKNAFLSMDRAQNMLVIKTVPGMAMGVAAALDMIQISGVVGTIAGYDTVMCAIRNLEDVEPVMEKLNKLVVRS